MIAFILLISSILIGDQVSLLGSDCFWERKEAQEKLERVNNLHLYYLSNYKTKDYEVKARLKNIIERICTFNIAQYPRLDTFLHIYWYGQGTWLSRYITKKYNPEENWSTVEERLVTARIAADLCQFIPKRWIEKVLLNGWKKENPWWKIIWTM